MNLPVLPSSLPAYQRAARQTSRAAGKSGSTLRAALIASEMVLMSVSVGGCFQETFQKGYILPDGALEQIPLGAAQDQVLVVLGTPSTVATLDGEVFYYISQHAERKVAFLNQEVVDQRVSHNGDLLFPWPAGETRVVFRTRSQVRAYPARPGLRQQPIDLRPVWRAARLGADRAPAPRPRPPPTLSLGKGALPPRR